MRVQPKLKISQSDDEYEREADQTAEVVMRMPAPATPPPPDDEDKPTNRPNVVHRAPVVSRAREEEDGPARRVKAGQRQVGDHQPNASHDDRGVPGP